jgi:pimeloyl-ACP methyl ester carboxylesterase
MKARVNRVPRVPAAKTFVTLGGVRQGMFITGSDPSRPVLLHLHGGMPEFFLERRHPSGLERLFTVVWWEQRGSGLSYLPGETGSAVTVDQLLDDAAALAEQLCRRFGQRRVYLMGHSGGSFLGMQAIARAPELFHAYVGVAQISDQLASELEAHAFMVEECRRRGEKRLGRRLEGCSVLEGDCMSPAYLRVRDSAMHRLGVGTVRSMRSVVSGMFLPSLLCGDYSMGERVRLWIAKARAGTSVVWDTIVATDLREVVPEVRVPVYFLHGVHDRTCSYALARDYFRTLRAPRKGFYSFQHSAHSPHFEEPERMRRIVREDVLRGRTELADNEGMRPNGANGRKAPGPWPSPRDSLASPKRRTKCSPARPRSRFLASTSRSFTFRAPSTRRRRSATRSAPERWGFCGAGTSRATSSSDVGPRAGGVG